MTVTTLTRPINTELLGAVLDKVHQAADAGQYDQTKWDSCVAGWLCRMDGADMTRTDGFGTCRLRDRFVEIDDYARERLGLTEDEAHLLFSEDLTLADVEHVAAELSSGIDPGTIVDDLNEARYAADHSAALIMVS